MVPRKIRTVESAFTQSVSPPHRRLKSLKSYPQILSKICYFSNHVLNGCSLIDCVLSDLKNPAANRNKTAGFTDQEREGKNDSE